MRTLAQLASVLLLVGLTAAQQAAPAQAPASSDMVQKQKLNALLARTGEQVSRFLEQFSDVKCTEQVIQLKLGQNGKVENKEESTFDYLAILTSAGGELNLSESRLAEKQSKTKKNESLLVTNGFATLFLVFHPYYQGSFRFSELDEEVMDGRQYARVRFQHIPGTRSPMAMVLRGREYPLDLSGTAWIDPVNGVIAKMDAGLENGLEDLGLRSLRSEVQFTPVQFRDTTQSYWFPTVATIEVETPKQHWRNIHRFTDYKRFSVSTQEAVSSKQ